jgi:hypothetical protein
MTPTKGSKAGSAPSRTTPAAPAFVPPYPPSFVDRLTDWVDRLPIPWWLFYVMLAAAWSGIVAVVLWQTGVYAAVGFHPMQIWLPTLAAYLLGLIHGLDRVAASAMQRFRPAFRGDGSQFAAAVYRITTLPARPTLIFTIVVTVITIPLGQYEMSMVQTGGLERVPAVFLAVLAVLYVASYPFFYHVWHQLREIHRLHRDWSIVRVTGLRPLYALSRISALTALGIILNNYGWYLAQPGADPNNPVFLGETLFAFVIVLVAFVWPLWTAHRRIAEAKEQAQGDLAARKQSTREQLHQAGGAGRLERVDPLHKTLAALQAESDELAKVPTWPWAPGTLRNLVGAVLVPMALWLLQFGLQKLLG